MQIRHAIDDSFFDRYAAELAQEAAPAPLAPTPLMENAADDLLQSLPGALAEAQAEARRRWLRLTPVISVVSGLTGVVVAAAITSGPGILLGLLPALPPLLVLWVRMSLERQQQGPLGFGTFLALLVANLWPTNLLGMVLGVVWADRPVNRFQETATATLAPAIAAQVPGIRVDAFEDRPVIEPGWVLGSGLLASTHPEWRGENLLSGQVTLQDGSIHPFMLYQLGVWPAGQPQEPVFDGLVVQMQWLREPLTGRTWVHRHHGLDPASVDNVDGLFMASGDRFSGMRTVAVEDDAFNALFVARSRDMAESHRLLTAERVAALVTAAQKLAPDYELSMVSWDESGWMTVALRGETPWLEMLETGEGAEDRGRIARSMARLAAIPQLLGALDGSPAKPAARPAEVAEDEAPARPYRVRFHAA